VWSTKDLRTLLAKKRTHATDTAALFTSPGDCKQENRKKCLGQDVENVGKNGDR